MRQRITGWFGEGSCSENPLQTQEQGGRFINTTQVQLAEGVSTNFLYVKAGYIIHNGALFLVLLLFTLISTVNVCLIENSKMLGLTV